MDALAQRQTMLKISRRLLPLVVISYLVAYIDRTNVAFAALTMNADLGISAYLYGWGAGIFFIGYALFEVPSNIILARVGARRWIARIMITWGIVSGLQAFATGPLSFILLRFLLGVAEAGFFPGMLYYLTLWYPARYRGRVISALFLAVPVSNALASALSAAILTMDGVLGLAGWQWIFIIECLPAIVLGAVVWKYLTERPAVAHWLSPQEKSWLQGELEAEHVAVSVHGKSGLLAILADPRLLILSFIWMTTLTASYGLVFFLPQIVRDLGYSTLMTGVLSSIPYVLGVLALLVAGWSTDHYNERRWHLILMLALGGLGLCFAGWSGKSGWAIVGMCIACMGIYASRPPFWPMPSMFLVGTSAAAGIAFINSLGNLGGYIGPFIVGWIRDSTGGYAAALYFLGGSAGLAALVGLFAWRTTGAVHARTPA
jgi:MFS transporter, ACS family, tartrate transporter